ncbi:MAG: hypothetical protein GVX78_05750 [Bacteroidetes bacterium]|jgi:hypothetical protein|nr:hypothetical protein [Bacteroidota bacterium]
MNWINYFIVFVLAVWPLTADVQSKSQDWGFFAHRRINQLAVFTLPYEMLPLFKSNIEYLRTHAVDPDKRRYASVFEAIRHYIDLDIWEKSLPVDTVPKDWNRVLFQYADIYAIDGRDTVWYRKGKPINWQQESSLQIGKEYKVNRSQLLKVFDVYIMPQYYEEEWSMPADSFQKYTRVPAPGDKVYWVDNFSQHGVLPYHLEQMQYRLTEAFVDKNVPLILRLAAEMGHYIGDANVPLHTTENYNGQLTGQVGIHAFWESRIPELFSEDYDFFIKKATYQADKSSFFWSMVTQSHSLVDSVLTVERRLRKTYPESQQMCFDERLGRTVLTQCRDFAKAYSAAMEGMVEERMRNSIWAIGSSWYTAWVDAGQPDFDFLNMKDSGDSSSLYTGPPETTRSMKKRLHDN